MIFNQSNMINLIRSFVKYLSRYASMMKTIMCDTTTRIRSNGMSRDRGKLKNQIARNIPPNRVSAGNHAFKDDGGGYGGNRTDTTFYYHICNGIKDDAMRRCEMTR